MSTITLPEATDVINLLEMLVGKPTGLTCRSGELDVMAPAEGTYVSFLSDAEGRKVGAVVADLSAALHLGGAMIMLPVGPLLEEQAAGVVPEAVIDAVGEIFNNVRALVNRKGSNPHVTPSDPVLLAEADPADLVLLRAAAEQLSLSGDTPFGQGNFLLLTF